MENLTPEQLNKLISEMKKGSMDPTSADAEITWLLRQGLSIPKRQVPRPIKRFRFAEAQTAYKLSTLFLQFAASLFVILLFVTFAASQSVPGQKLYSLKRVAVEMQLDLIRDPAERANARLSLVEKRIDETEIILRSSQNDQQIAAALKDLAAQTKSAVDNVKATPATDEGQTNQNLITSLNKIAEKQEELLQNFDNETGEGSTEAGTETKVAVEEVKAILATVNDHAIASIGKSTQEVEGTINRISKDSLTLDQTFVAITKDTKIFLLDGKTEKPITVLTVKMKAKITAKVTDDKLEALSIILQDELKDVANPQVKGAATTTTAQQSENPQDIIDEQNKTQA